MTIDSLDMTREFRQKMAMNSSKIIAAFVLAALVGNAAAQTNFSFVAAGEVFLLVRDLERRTRYFLERLQQAGYDGYGELRVLLEVMHYARSRHLGVLELTDAVDSFGRPALFPEANVRGGVRGALSWAVDERLRECLRRTA